MSMLSSQCERLRDRADELRMLASGMAAPYIVPETKKTMAMAMLSAASEMHEAADTIEKLVPHSDQLEPSRWHELFGTPELAARTLAGICESCKCGDCATCGVPEWADYSHDYDALLEWLKGGSE